MLTSDNKDRITGEPSGEPDTLWGRINPSSFGDRVHRSKPSELDDRMKKAKDKRRGGGLTVESTAQDPGDTLDLVCECGRGVFSRAVSNKELSWWCQ